MCCPAKVKLERKSGEPRKCVQKLIRLGWKPEAFGSLPYLDKGGRGSPLAPSQNYKKKQRGEPVSSLPS